MKSNLKDIVYELLKEELTIDKSVDHLSKIKPSKKRSEIYEFEVNSFKYEVEFITKQLERGDVLSVSFKNLTAIDSLKKKKFSSAEEMSLSINNAKYGLTKTGNPLKVFREIYNVVGKYLLDRNPTFITYEAVEENRKRLYHRLIKSVQKETGIKFERCLVDPETSFHLTASGQTFIFKLSYPK